MSKQMRIRLVLALSIVVFFSILLAIVIARGGTLSGVNGIKDFTLCQADNAGEIPRPLGAIVLTPTTVIHACGYLDVSLSYPGDLCFYYKLIKDNETVFRPQSYYCVLYHSQYFSFPVTTSELLVPGAYELYAYITIERDRSESIHFEISQSP
jgi:hypothetical protein